MNKVQKPEKPFFNISLPCDCHKKKTAPASMPPECSVRDKRRNCGSVVAVVAEYVHPDEPELNGPMTYVICRPRANVIRLPSHSFSSQKRKGLPHA
jgi:hypothetical protein